MNPEVAATLATIRERLTATVNDATAWLARHASASVLVGQQWCVVHPDGFGSALRAEGHTARWVTVRGDLCGVSHWGDSSARKYAEACGGRVVHMADLVQGRLDEARDMLATLAAL